MELTPQTLHAVEFREARRGGSNTRDVDDFIERIAGSVGHLNDRAREAQARADAAESRLVELQHEIEELRRRPQAAAEPRQPAFGSAALTANCAAKARSYAGRASPRATCPTR